VYYNNKISVTPITDLELSYKPIKSVKFSIGANNIFNIYPDQKNAGLLQSYRDANDSAAVPIYPTFSPFGFNGGFYYVKLGYTF